MSLTQLGLKSVVFYLALVGAFFASPYSNLFFLLLGFLTLVGLASVLWTRRNLRGVRALLLEAEPVVAGSQTSLPARVETAAGRAAFQVSIELQLEHGERAVHQVDWVKGQADVALHTPPLTRGVYPLRSAFVSSTYPFGLMRVRRPVDGEGKDAEAMELVVYPSPTSLVSARTSSEALAELLGEQTTGAGDLQPSGLRDHREGDELRSVHWRATARRGKPVVREWEGGGGRGLEVLLDRRCEPEELEESLSIVSALVALARTEKEVLAIATQGQTATYGEGHRPWGAALRLLATLDTLPPDGPAPPPVSPSVTRLPAAAHAR